MSGSILDLYLPMKSIMMSPSNPKEFSLKTVPAASKTDIKRTLKMLGFEVEKVRTLNMQGKKKGRGARLVTKPNYKKAYVTLRNPQGGFLDNNSANLSFN